MMNDINKIGKETFSMLKKLILTLLVIYAVWAVSAYLNDKVMRKYFMPLVKFKDLVVDDNLSERDENFGFKSKVWLYNINTPQKLSKAFNEYEGFEIDVVYDEKNKTFVVGRDAEDKEITLDDMFATEPDLSKKFFWLDIKNLDYKNKAVVLRDLIELTGRNIIHNSRLIIVSPNSEYLGEFADSGFLTAFYFPPLYRVKRGDLYELIKKTTEKYKNSTVDFVCGDVRYFNFMDYYFPGAAKMYWNIGREAKNINPYILKHADTSVVLNQEPEVKKKPR